MEGIVVNIGTTLTPHETVRLNEKLDQIIEGVKALAHTQAEFETKLSAISTTVAQSATVLGTIATGIADLKTQLANAGLSADQESAVFDKIDSIGTAANALKQGMEAAAASLAPAPVTPGSA